VKLLLYFLGFLHDMGKASTIIGEIVVGVVLASYHGYVSVLLVYRVGSKINRGGW